MTRLLLVGAGIMGAGYVDAAARRGLEVGLVERDRWHDTYRDRVARIFPCSASTDQHWTAATVDAARRWPPDVVVGFAEPQVLAAAWVQDELGLPGPGLRAAVASRDKALQRTLGERANVPQPQFRLARDQQEAADFARDRYPVVVKALRSTGSRGVTAATGPDELVAALEGIAGSDPVLVERMVDGPEYSCEALTIDGEIVFENLTRKTTSGAPEFVEIAHVLPADLPAESTTDSPIRAGDEIRRAVRATIAALDVRTSLVHLEFRLVGHRVFVLETAVRTPGDHIMELLGHAYGVDMYDEVLSCYLGSGTRRWQPQRSVGIRYLRPAPGTVTAVGGVRAASAVPGVHRVEVSYQPGQVVVPARSSGERGGYVIASGSSPEDVTATLAASVSCIQVLTT